MKHRDAQTPVPVERSRTIRQQIIDRLRDAPLSAGVLSGELGLSEKQVRSHLESLRKQVNLVITPPRCGACGFEFKGRRRAGKPGKCPECLSTRIQEPLFSVAPD